MRTTYQAIMLTEAGGPEVLQCVELPMERAGPGQLRVRVRAAGVGSTDLTVIAGNYSFAPKMPFVPGYDIAGTIDAIGPGVIGFQLDQRVAALTVYGGFGEFLVREAEHCVPSPEAVTNLEAAAVILNYVTARRHAPNTISPFFRVFSVTLAHWLSSRRSRTSLALRVGSSAFLLNPASSVLLVGRRRTSTVEGVGSLRRMNPKSGREARQIGQQAMNRHSSAQNGRHKADILIESASR
jgi:hypothetical protein